MKLISNIEAPRLSNAIKLSQRIKEVLRELTGSYQVDQDLCEALGWQLSILVPEGVHLHPLESEKVSPDDIKQWLKEQGYLLEIEPESPSKKKIKITEIDNRPEASND